MAWRGTPPPNGTASPSFPVPNTSVNTQPAPLIPQSPWNFPDARLRTPSPAPASRGWKPWTSSPPQMPEPQPAPPGFLRIAPGILNAANVLMAPAAFPPKPTPYNEAQTTGQQNLGRTSTFATNNALPGFAPPPGSAPLNQNRPPPSSQTAPPLKSPPPPPLWLQQRNNNDAVDDLSIDLGRPSHGSRNPSWPLTDRDSSMAPSRSGSSGVSIMSSAWASTTVEGGDEPDERERAIGTLNITTDQPKSSSTQQAEDLAPPCFERLMEKREPLDLSGQVVIPPLPEPMMGGYGLVYLGNLGDKQVAVKMLKATKIKEDVNRPKSDDEIRAEERNERRLRREINVWAALKHRNICELLGFADDRHDYRVMVSPWYKRGSAANLLNKPNLTLDDRKRLTKEVCEGLHYLHRLRIIHGDMKPTNVLVDDDGVARLCDFGLVKLHDWEGTHGMTTTSPFAGTTRYKAPELFISNENRWPEATLEGDIYSLGCMMVEFIEGVRPFKRFKSSKGIANAIIDCKPPVLPEETELALGKQFWILLEMCWHIEKARRPVGQNGLHLCNIRGEDSIESAVGLWTLHRLMPGLEDEQSMNMDKLTQLQDCIEQLLLIMKLALAQLSQRVDFKQVSPDIPITKSRPKDKTDPPQKFEENKRELVADLVLKAKQIELLIESLPAPEPEQAQAMRFGLLEQEMQKTNEEYEAAVERAKRLHKEITAVFRELTNAENNVF